MTEAEWLHSGDVDAMVRFLADQIDLPARRAGQRKLRLFACACCRRWEHLLADGEVRKALDAAERYADGQLADKTIQGWYRKAHRARDRERLPADVSPPWPAYHAVMSAAVPGKYSTYLYAHREILSAAAGSAGGQQGSEAWKAAEAAESRALSGLLRDIVGNPFRAAAIDPGWLAWQGGTVGKLAREIYDHRAFERLPILADALEEAGSTDADLLGHCRSPGPHVRGCWPVDALLGKS
jgi:hypothetical protein